MKNPKITVIIPAYNSEKYIGRCLDSVLRQTWQDFEVVVINDGSKDDTGKIVREYTKRDKRIRYIEQKNMGVARTRNKAIGLANGEFIAFMDNDDYVDEDYLEKLLPRNGEDVVISGFKRPNNEGKIVGGMQLQDEEWSRFLNPTPWAKIYRKDFIVDNKLLFLDNDIGEDIYFNIIAMLITKRVKIVDYVGYNWYLNEESTSSTKHKSYKEVNIFKLLNSSYDELEKRGLIEKNYELLEYFFYRFIIWFILYACKGQKKVEINKVYNELFGWLGGRFPDYQNNLLLKGELRGEIKKTKIICRLFNRFHKLGLGRCLVIVYAKI